MGSGIMSVVKSAPQMITSLIAIAASQGTVTGTSLTASQAFKAMGKAAWESLGPFLPIILGVIAALAALTAIISVVIKSMNAEADAAKLAAERAEALTEAYHEVTRAYDELKNSIESYKSARDSIDSLS